MQELLGKAKAFSGIATDDIESVREFHARTRVEFERYDVVDEDGVSRRGGPYIAWFRDPAGNILSILQERS